jgi:O-antigen ligase
LADRDRDHPAGEPAALGKQVYRFLTRAEVLGAIYIAILCAAFLLGTRLHRNLFYVAALPPFLLALPALDWRRYASSTIARLALAYLAYFLLSSLWSDGLTLEAFADLLRVSLLLLLFLALTTHLATRDDRFAERLFFWFAASAGASLLAVFAAAALGLLPFGPRFTGFGLAVHPVIGATLYGVALLLAAFELLPRAAGWRPRLAWVAVILLCAAFILLSGSRGPLLALAAALVVGLAVADRRLALGVAALLAAGIAVGLLSDLRTIELLYTRSQSGHFEIWQQALAAIPERPWLGHGSLADIDFVGKDGPGRSPHNLLLANQLYGGLPATLLLAVLLLLAARQAWRAQRGGRPVYLVLLVFGLVASLFDTRSLVQNLGREWITLWLPIGLLTAQESLRRGRSAS